MLFPNDNHKYRYNRDKLISNILKNKISDHLYTMSPKTLNKKTKKPTNTDTLDVDLKFKKFYDDEGKEYGRTFVNKDKFPEFEYDYQDSQDNSSLNTTSSVEFEIHINARNINKVEDKVHKLWISMTTVLGGINGIKLYIKKKNYGIDL